jgi:hypothetical protein
MRRWLFLLALALLTSSAHALPDGLAFAWPCLF